MYDFKFELGEGVKDVISGFSGVVMGRSQFLTGCNQYSVSPTKLDKDGKRQDWEYFDENRLVATGKSVKLPTSKDESKPVRGFDGKMNYKKQ